MGKAKTFSDDARESVYQKEVDNELFSTVQQNSYNLGSTHFSDQSGIGNFSQAGGDQRKANLKGVLFQGNVGFNLQTVLLDVGTETIDLNNDDVGDVLSVISTDRLVTLSAGTTSNLTTITGAQRPGQRLRLYNTTTNTITVKHTGAATVNTIRTPTATDLNFPGDAIIDLTFDITSAQWRVVGNIAGSGGGEFFGPWTANHDAGLQDLTNIGNLDFNDALSTIFGLVEIQWFQGGHSIISLSGELKYAVDTTHSHKFFTGANEILEINSSGINLNGENISEVEDINFNDTLSTINDLRTLNFFENGHLIDSIGTKLQYKVPSSESHSFQVNLVEILEINSSGIDLKGNNIIGVEDLTFNDTLSTIAGLRTLNFFEGGHLIDSIASDLQYKVDTGDSHSFQVNLVEVLEINSTGIVMANNKIISNVDQIGFRNTGNIIEDDANGLIFKTIPSDDFTWSDGTNTFATLDIDGLFLNQLFIQFTSIASPGVTGSANVGELFMDSGNSDHLSIIRNASVIDLEGGGGGETNTASNVGTGLGKVFKTKVGVDLQFKSILAGASIEIVNGTDDVQISATSDGNQDATPFVDPTSGNPLVEEDVYMSNSKQGLEISNTTTAQEDLMEYVPIFLGRTTNIDRLAWVKADAVSVGSISWTIGIYDSVHSSPNVGANYPADLIVSGNTTSTSTEGIKFIGISPTTLSPGLYWLGFLITNISTAATLVASARHETANANCVGYYPNPDANDRMDNILSYTEAETSIPSSAPAEMGIIGANPMALFYRVNTVS